jgi:alcohol dehydrogenase
MDLNRVYTWQMPVRLIIGPGCSRQAGEELKNLGGRKALVVTDRGVRGAGVLVGLLEGLEQSGVAYEIYEGVEPNPTIRCVEEGLALYRRGSCDCLLGVGGGSSMDTAKVVGAAATNNMEIRDLMGYDKVKTPIPPLILVPTTCGTASEVTKGGVITDPARHFKFGVLSPLLFPKVALIDSTLLTKLPGPVIAATGMDAFCHAFESYTNLNTDPISDALDLQAIGMIARWLRPAVANANVEAMSHMVLASTMAGMGFTNTTLTILHAMSLPLSAYYGLPHGIANAVMLPHVMEFNLIGNPQRYTDVAKAMGEDTSGLTVMEAARLSIKAVRELSRDVGIPETFESFGVTEEHLDAMVEDTFKSSAVLVNPVRVTREIVAELYRRAMK